MKYIFRCHRNNHENPQKTLPGTSKPKISTYDENSDTNEERSDAQQKCFFQSINQKDRISGQLIIEKKVGYTKADALI